MFDARLGELKDDVDAGRLDVGVDDADAVAGPGDQHGEVGRRVRLAGAAAKGVSGDDFGQELSSEAADEVAGDESAKRATAARRRCYLGRPRRRLSPCRADLNRCDSCSSSSNSAPLAILSASRAAPLLVQFEHRQRVDVDLVHRHARAWRRACPGRTAASGPVGPRRNTRRAAAAPRRPSRLSISVPWRPQETSIQDRRRRRTSVTWCRETCGSEITISRASSRPIVISRSIGESPGLNRLALRRIEQLQTDTTGRNRPVLVAHRP